MQRGRGRQPRKQNIEEDLCRDGTVTCTTAGKGSEGRGRARRERKARETNRRERREGREQVMEMGGETGERRGRARSAKL